MQLVQLIIKHHRMIRWFLFLSLLLNSVALIIHAYEGTFHWFGLDFWLFVSSFVNWTVLELTYKQDEKS